MYSCSINNMYKNEEWLRRMKGWYYLQEAKAIFNKFQQRTWEAHQLISTTKFKYTLFSTEVYREQNKTMLFHSLEYTYAILFKQWIMEGILLNIFTIITKHYKKNIVRWWWHTPLISALGREIQWIMNPESVFVYVPHLFIPRSKRGWGRQHTSLTWYKK